MAIRPVGFYLDDPAAALVPSLVSVLSQTTVGGAATGLTLVDAALIGQSSYEGGEVIIIDGGAAGQSREITAHALGTGILTVDRPFTDGAGAIQTILAGTRYIIKPFPLSIANITSIIEMLARPRVSLIETWQDELGLDFTVWSVVNPATGAAWSRGATGAYLRAISIPNANEVARLRSNQRWVAAPDVYGVNTILRRLIFEFEVRFTSLANLDNTQCLFGLTTGIADTRGTPNIIAWALVGAGNALQTVTDDGGAETVNTGFGETLTNWNKLRIDILPTSVQFYLNEVLVATHTTNLPDFPFYLNGFIDTNAGGAATLEVAIVRVWTEDMVRP